MPRCRTFGHCASNLSLTFYAQLHRRRTQTERNRIHHTRLPSSIPSEKATPVFASTTISAFGLFCGMFLNHAIIFETLPDESLGSKVHHVLRRKILKRSIQHTRTHAHMHEVHASTNQPALLSQLALDRNARDAHMGLLLLRRRVHFPFFSVCVRARCGNAGNSRMMVASTLQIRTRRQECKFGHSVGTRFSQTHHPSLLDARIACDFQRSKPRRHSATCNGIEP